MLLLTGTVVWLFSYVVQMTLAPLKELENVKGLSDTFSVRLRDA